LVRTTKITVTTAPTLLCDPAGASVTNPRTFVIQNVGAAAIFVGGVTRDGTDPQLGGAAYTLSSTGGQQGYTIAAGAERSFDIDDPSDKLYALVAASTNDVVVLAFGSN